MEEGTRLQVAYRAGVALGFIEYYPIQATDLELAGQDIVAVWCMLVSEERQGNGSRNLFRSRLPATGRSPARGIVNAYFKTILRKYLPPLHRRATLVVLQ